MYSCKNVEEIGETRQESWNCCYKNALHEFEFHKIQKEDLNGLRSIQGCRKRKKRPLSLSVSTSCALWTLCSFAAAFPTVSTLSTRSTLYMSTLHHSSSLSVNSENILKLLGTARKLRVERSGAGADIKSNYSRYSTLDKTTSWQNLFNEDSVDDSIHAALLERQDELMSSRVEAQMDSIQSLRTSLGSEIPDMELYLQMEAARSRARGHPSASAATLAFMDVHHSKDSVHHEDNNISKNSKQQMAQTSSSSRISVAEKVAMTTLPSQLPNLATKALNARSLKKSEEGSSTIRAQKSSASAAKTKVVPTHSHRSQSLSSSTANEISTLVNERNTSASTINDPEEFSMENDLLDDASSTSVRLSHEQEIQLARIIQRGVDLHNLKSKFEQAHGRDITKKEWTELAKLDSPKELRRLVSDYRQAKNKIVMANMGLVHAVVRSRLGASISATSSSSDVSTYEELVQEGSLGLLRAAELFDPSRGLRFSTYATIWIKGVLGHSSIGETIKLPAREKTKWNKINSAIQDLMLTFADSGNTHTPTEEEIGKKCGLDPSEVKAVITKMKRARNVLSLDYQYNSQSRSGNDTGTYNALLNDKNLMDDVDLVERLHVRADVIAALARNLDAREARFVRLRYGLNDGQTRSIAECAESMGISRSLAQQLSIGCLKKLREADDAQSLQEYLLSIA